MPSTEPLISEARQAQIDAYRRMTPARKWAEACKMRDLAWDLKYAGLKTVHPDWSDAQLKAEVRKIFLYATT
jgi:hypothetical protein